jgi:hypothetical protein
MSDPRPVEFGNNPDDPAEWLANQVVQFALDELPSWRDNDPYYALWHKVKELANSSRGKA